MVEVEVIITDGDEVRKHSTYSSGLPLQISVISVTAYILPFSKSLGCSFALSCKVVWECSNLSRIKAASFLEAISVLRSKRVTAASRQ